MKVILTKVLALGGLCALLVGAGSTAFAQGYDRNDQNNRYDQNNRFDHRDMGRDNHSMVFGTRQRILDLQREYAHDIRIGDYEGARRAHFRAAQLRAQLRDHRGFNG
jgi:hypothetical protein